MIQSKTFFKYSKQLAAIHGVEAAALLQFIAFGCQRHHTGNKMWFFHSAKRISEHYQGFLSVSGINRILNRLRDEGMLEAKHREDKPGDRTLCYAFKLDSMRQVALANDGAIYFAIEDAARYGSVLKAVLIQNIAYWVESNRETDTGYKWHRLPSRKLATCVGAKKSSVSRALAELVATSVLATRYNAVEGNCEYCFLDETGFFKPKKSNVPKIAMVVPKVVMGVPKVAMLKIVEEIVSRLEEHKEAATQPLINEQKYELGINRFDSVLARQFLRNKGQSQRVLA